MRLLCLLLFASFFASAQVSSGSFYGDARDQSDAYLTGVRIVVRGEKNGFTRQTTTGVDGAYRVPDLDPGEYSITAEKNGFSASVISHIKLEINQTARVDVSLTLGPAHQTVTVESDLSAIQTDDPSEGFHFNSELLNQLPIDGRNILSLVTVGPGAIPRQLGGFGHDGDNDVQASSRGAVAFNPPINGARPAANSYFIDGAYNTDRNIFSAVITPPLDSVQEFRVQSSLAGPAFLQSAGGVIDIATKSGTREFHGDVFEYLRNEATDAHNYFDDTTLPRPVFRRNQFGGSLGGPAGLKSTFFFLSYEGLRSTAASSSRQLVPDAAFRGGNFAGDGIIYDPLTLNAAGARAAFANNVIPTSRIDPIASKYLSLYEPLPNHDGGSSSNYLDATPSVSTNNSGSARIDHQFGRAGQLFGRYTINNELGDFAGSFPLLPTSEDLRAQQVSLGYTFSTGSSINTFRGSFTSLKAFRSAAKRIWDKHRCLLGNQ